MRYLGKVASILALRADLEHVYVSIYLPQVFLHLYRHILSVHRKCLYGQLIV